MKQSICVVYKVTNVLNSRYYIGVHKTKNPNDSYLGSGLAIKRAIEKYGKENFTKTILHIFEEEQEAFNKEVEILLECLNDELCYNVAHGGKGGFTLIHKNRDIYPNPMTIPEHKEKNRLARIEFYKTDRGEALKQTLRENNIKKAIASNTGKKRAEHSEFMSNVWRERWDTDKEKYRNQLSSTFELTSPSGEVIVTNRLEDKCKELGLSYVPVWNTSRTGKPVTKGRSKGWTCRKI